ncbi:MAG: pilus assembly protein, partial [Sphingomonadales bacterium]|nr:pilus assembly protein [Sphingomonadales bacterium]
GDGNWDRDAYFKVNYNLNHAGWTTLTGLSSTATRYDVYKWEKANTTYLAKQNVSPPNGGFAAYSQPVCNPAQSTSDPDRRRMVIAVVNCLDQASKISGNGKVAILKWVDVFLVEPAFDRGSGASKRTTSDQVYVEIIGGSTLGGGNSIAAQSIRRDVPYLVH